MPAGNLVLSHCRTPFESRPLIQQSSMLTYWYPAAAMPLETIASATPLIRDSLGLQPKLFHEFQPMGGVAPTTALPVPPPPPVAPLAPPAGAPPLPPACAPPFPPAPAAPPASL